MKIVLDVGQIDYAAIAVKALPLLRDRIRDMDGPAARMLGSLASLPEPLVRTTVAAMPESTKDQMVAYLVNSNEERIIAATQSFAEKQGICLAVNSIRVEE